MMEWRTSFNNSLHIIFQQEDENEKTNEQKRSLFNLQRVLLSVQQSLNRVRKVFLREKKNFFDFNRTVLYA